MVAEDLQQVERVICKLKTHYYRQGNRAGKLLAYQLKERTSHMKIPYLLDGTGSKQISPKMMVDEFAAFYEALYNLSFDPSQHQPTQPEILYFLDGVGLPQLSSDQAASVDRPITMDEVSKALKDTPRHKALGPDGFSTYYYNVFEDQLIAHDSPV
ncbi:Hypothetical predicted protein [Pelobates cultripes]|uniref:Uncharacterized protein n=1 Tax=Pelobates cultripes TaxID=61616 RepID=A0AAD1RNI8_PELCU|nr:Hypothetical predicted protein [Pelobates cultripes]